MTQGSTERWEGQPPWCLGETLRSKGKLGAELTLKAVSGLSPLS